MLRKQTPTNHNLNNVDSAKALSNRTIRLDKCDMSEVFPALDVEVRGYLNKLTLLGKLGKEMLLSSKLNDKYD
jgi:hypothetical protein